MKSLFNPQGDDSAKARQVWGGNPTNLIVLNDAKYKWATNLYQLMRNQFWQPQKVDLSEDINNYRKLTPDERRAYKALISYLTYLDSIQTCNIPIITQEITAPEIKICLAEHCSQEAMHNQSYQVLIEAVIPKDEHDEVYYTWRDDAQLRKRVEAIASLYQDYIDNKTTEALIKTLLANYFLECIYFQSGFIFFYSLAMRNLMLRTTDMIKLINRDEVTHVRLFQELIMIAANTFDKKEVIKLATEMIEPIVKAEIEWYNYLYQNNILGITSQSTREYIHYLAYTKLKALRLGIEQNFPQWSLAQNPYKHIERLADVSSEGSSKPNFFESTNTNYVLATTVGGWEGF